MLSIVAAFVTWFGRKGAFDYSFDQWAISLGWWIVFMALAVAGVALWIALGLALHSLWAVNTDAGKPIGPGKISGESGETTSRQR